MKAVGIVRNIDRMGRLVLPQELRDINGLESGTPMEIYVGNEGEITLKKYEPGCAFCGSVEKIQHFKGKNVCLDCIDKIRLTV